MVSLGKYTKNKKNTLCLLEGFDDHTQVDMCLKLIYVIIHL